MLLFLIRYNYCGHAYEKSAIPGQFNLMPYTTVNIFLKYKLLVIIKL